MVFIVVACGKSHHQLICSTVITGFSFLVKNGCAHKAQLFAFGVPGLPAGRIRDAGGGKWTRRCFVWQLCVMLPLSLCPCHPAIVQAAQRGLSVCRSFAPLCPTSLHFVMFLKT